MIALYIVAAGIVAAAVALMLARTPAKLRTADQRGITLQTLIVTAVLVLMAGAAGVVIIAITNNAQDNLEGQDVGIDSRCDPWEIFDPTLDAAGRGGGEGGIDSSASGCVRVCYVRFTPTAWTAPAADGTFGTIGVGGTDLKLTGASSTTTAELVLSRTNIYDNERSANSTAVVLPVNGARTVDSNGNAEDARVLIIDNINSVEGDGTLAGGNLENYEIQVSPNGRNCRVWDYTDDEEITAVRSS